MEQDTEIGNALPPRLKREDPEYEMMVGGHGLRPAGWALGQWLQGDGGVGMATALQPQQVQLALTTLMQGRTIPLQYNVGSNGIEPIGLDPCTPTNMVFSTGCRWKQTLPRWV